MKENIYIQDLANEIQRAETWEEAEDAAKELCDLAGVPLRQSEEDDITDMVEQIFAAAGILGVII